MTFVSVIIPCRNEKKFISRCLDTIIKQDYPKENLEVLVVDGMSEDGTREIIKNYSQKYPLIKILDNPNLYTPFALNIGIRESKGEIIVRIDAHTSYEKDYISKCVFRLIESGADNVGGSIKTVPLVDTLEACAIAYSLSSPFGANSDFRLGIQGVKSVDTVFGGCFKKELFNEIGLFNEKMIRSQDLEFNLRIKEKRVRNVGWISSDYGEARGKILLFSDIISSYSPQETFIKFFKHNFVDGIWAIYPLKFIKTKFKLRHYIPLIFILTLPLSIWFYVPLSLFFSLEIAIKENDLRFLFLMPLAFFSRHFGYGLGSIFGAIKIFTNYGRT